MTGCTSHVSGCGLLPHHCTVLTCTICPIICLNVLLLRSILIGSIVFPIHDHSWKQQLAQHQFWINSSNTGVGDVARIVTFSSFRNWVSKAASRWHWVQYFNARVEWRLSDPIRSFRARGIRVVARPLFAAPVREGDRGVRRDNLLQLQLLQALLWSCWLARLEWVAARLCRFNCFPHERFVCVAHTGFAKHCLGISYFLV